MKILLFGTTGQVGTELSKTLTALGELITVERSQIDVTKSNNLYDYIIDTAPTVIVNATAFTAVDLAETNKDLATAVNATAPLVMAAATKKLNALLVHYSTDYVFDGSISYGYSENESPNPINVYGYSKYVGEKNILISGCKSLIFRTSWVHSPYGNNFLKTILRLLKEKDEISIVNTQFGVPTSAKRIAETTAEILSQHSRNLGLYHLVSSGYTSWYEYAKFIQTMSNLNTCLINPVENYETVAIRPKNTRLLNDKIQKHFNIQLPDWEVDVISTIEALNEQ